MARSTRHAKRRRVAVWTVAFAFLATGATFAGPARADGFDDARIAIEATRAGEYDKAVYFSTLAIYSNDLSDSDLAVAFTNRGQANRRLGYFRKALEDYNTAIELRPNFATALSNRAALFSAVRRYDLAIRDLNRAIEMQPDYAEAYNNRGVAYRLSGNLTHAINDLSEAIRLKPDFADAYHNRGIAYSYAGDYDMAVTDYSFAIDIRPDWHRAHSNRGFAAFYLGRFELAYADLSAVLANDESEPYTVIWRYLAKARMGAEGAAILAADARRIKRAGWPTPIIRFHLGEIDEAALLDAAARPAANDDDLSRRDRLAEGHFHIGQRQLIAGNPAAAADSFRTVIEIAPAETAAHIAAVAELQRMGLSVTIKATVRASEPESAKD